MIKLGIVLTLWWTSFAQASDVPSLQILQARLEIFDHFIMARDGVPPISEPAAIEKGKTTLLDKIENAKNEIEVGLRKQSKTCRRFIKSYSKVLSEIDDLVPRVIPLVDGWNLTQETWLYLSRLEIMGMVMQNLTLMLTHKYEAGVEMLNQQSGVTCSFADRSAVVARAEDLVESFNELMNDAFGFLGLESYQLQTSLLYSAMEDKQVRDRRVMMVSLGAGFVLSILVWSYAPVFFAKATMMSTATVANSFALRVSSQVIGLMALTYSQRYFSERFLFREQKLMVETQPSFNSWEAQMDFIDGFLSSPIKSPSLYFEILNQVKGRMFEELLVVLKVWEPELLSAEARWGSIDKAYAETQERLDLVLASDSGGQ